MWNEEITDINKTENRIKFGSVGRLRKLINQSQLRKTENKNYLFRIKIRNLTDSINIKRSIKQIVTFMKIK